MSYFGYVVKNINENEFKGVYEEIDIPEIKNDEVLMPSYNYNTTASSFVRTGCKVRYCDIQKENLMPSFDDFKKNVTKNTKVIVVIHMQGLAVSYLDKLKNFCLKNLMQFQ